MVSKGLRGSSEASDGLGAFGGGSAAANGLSDSGRGDAISGKGLDFTATTLTAGGTEGGRVPAAA